MTERIPARTLLKKCHHSLHDGRDAGLTACTREPAIVLTKLNFHHHNDMYRVFRQHNGERSCAALSTTTLKFQGYEY